MSQHPHVRLIALLTLLLAQSAIAECNILTTAHNPAETMTDSIGIILSSKNSCPKNVFDFRNQIKSAGLKIETTMVANRGFHNPSEGSFSFFEMVTGYLESTPISRGDFFFGHFTTVNDKNDLTADQSPAINSLMIEAFAWDPQKELFNFYELRGNGKEGQWFYRGDSADIYSDNAFLHRQPDPTQPQFGNHLRCSGCHSAGGPIMKEIHIPYNDWWEPTRKLDFGGRKFDASIQEIVENLTSPDRLAESVIQGIKKLENGNILSNKKTLSLQEKLRPLFCAVEINFKSDIHPNNDMQNTISIPIDFFINIKFADANSANILIPRNAYAAALTANHSHFPETTLADADHAWLTPVKATSDQISIDHLVKINLIDAKFAADVLSIDMTNPAFSSARCGLLKFIPNSWSPFWRDKFKDNLKRANITAADELVTHMNNPAHTPDYHQNNARKFISACREKMKDNKNIKKLFMLLAQRRVELKESEISKNPLGQILEPGFRVIFPEIDKSPAPEALTLTMECEVLQRAGS